MVFCLQAIEVVMVYNLKRYHEKLQKMQYKYYSGKSRCDFTTCLKRAYLKEKKILSKFND